MRIDLALTEDDPEQHWTNNYNYENKESIYINIIACSIFNSQHPTSMTHLTMSEQSYGWQTHTNTNQNHTSF